MLFVLAYPIGYARKLADTEGMRTYISRYARDRSKLRISKTKSTTQGDAFRFGLPDRIRTYGLQSRSLTRYPAVPRVDNVLILVSRYIVVYLSRLTRYTSTVA